MKASAESAPLCTCQVLSVGASINLHGCLLLAEGKALCEGISEVCASMLLKVFSVGASIKQRSFLQARRAQARWTKRWMQSASI